MHEKWATTSVCDYRTDLETSQIWWKSSYIRLLSLWFWGPLHPNPPHLPSPLHLNSDGYRSLTDWLLTSKNSKLKFSIIKAVFLGLHIVITSYADWLLVGKKNFRYHNFSNLIYEHNFLFFCDSPKKVDFFFFLVLRKKDQFCSTFSFFVKIMWVLKLELGIEKRGMVQNSLLIVCFWNYFSDSRFRFEYPLGDSFKLSIFHLWLNSKLKFRCLVKNEKE